MGLKWIKKVPEEILAQILNVLQTSSIQDLNAHFKHYTNTFTMLKDMADHGEQPPDDLLDLDTLLHIVESKYISFVSSGEWTGAKTKGKASMLTTNNSSKSIC